MGRVTEYHQRGIGVHTDGVELIAVGHCDPGEFVEIPPFKGFDQSETVYSHGRRGSNFSVRCGTTHSTRCFNRPLVATVFLIPTVLPVSFSFSSKIMIMARSSGQ